MDNNIFALLIKKEWADNRRQILLGLSVVWGTYILMGGFLGSLPAGAGTALFLFSFFTGLVISVGGSLAFSNMKTKEGRINTLMLPATMLQKYMVRWIAAVPMLLIIVVIGLFLGDGTRMLVERINDFSGIPAWEWIRAHTQNHEEELALLMTAIICSMLTVQALYFLGSVLWPKLSFIKTLAALQVLQIVLGILLVSFDINIRSTVLDSLTALIWSAWIFTAVFCGVIYWLAYVRFCRSQVVYKLF